MRSTKACFHTPWMRELKNPKQMVKDLCELRSNGLIFDTLVATGFSGTLPLMYVAEEIGVDWFAIRKLGESTHTGSPVEGTLGEKWLFMDDFIATGKTFAWVNHNVNKYKTSYTHTPTSFQGAYLYHNVDQRSGNMFIPPDHEEIQYALDNFPDTYFRKLAYGKMSQDFKEAQLQLQVQLESEKMRMNMSRMYKRKGGGQY